MKVALIGYGQMGKVVEEVAQQQEVEVAARFTGDRPLRADEATRKALTDVEALIDFSAPDAVVGTVEAAAALGRALVIGTTGWQAHMDAVRTRVEEAGIGLVYGSNFSLGINLFYRIVEQAAKLFSAFEDYDPFIQEWHHRFKKDSPSGTALEMERRMARHYPRRELPITSLRAGYIPSIHSAGFDSPSDTIHLEHRARSRQGFAGGALLAARWLAGRQGFYAFHDVLEDLYPGA